MIYHKKYLYVFSSFAAPGRSGPPTALLKYAAGHPLTYPSLNTKPLAPLKGPDALRTGLTCPSSSSSAPPPLAVSIPNTCRELNDSHKPSRRRAEGPNGLTFTSS